MSSKNARVVVGMSGGVDSSVAALLLQRGGYQVVGATMRIYTGANLRPGGAGAAGATPSRDRAAGRGIDSCYGPNEQADVEEAARVCAQLGIPHYEVDLREEYRSLVLEYARGEYLAGRTPNPCIRCNQRVKFGFLFERLRSTSGLELDYLATGHYCRIEPPEVSAPGHAPAPRNTPGLGHAPPPGYLRAPDRYALRRAKDLSKDQSYFLCMLSQEQLSRTLFPLGSMTKAQVRAIAREAGLPNHDRPESQDFAAGGYRDALDVPPREGPITDRTGKVLGRHPGIWGYTIGQRRGLGIGSGEPLYVTGLDAATNTVVAGPDSELYRRELVAGDVNWVSIELPQDAVRVAVKIRYRNAEAPATVHPLGAAGDGPTAGRSGSPVRVVFDDPQRAIALGQWAVFYDGDLVVGGGVIEE